MFLVHDIIDPRTVARLTDEARRDHLIRADHTLAGKDFESFAMETGEVRDVGSDREPAEHVCERRLLLGG